MAAIKDPLVLDLLVTFWSKFTVRANETPVPSQTVATDLLQVDAPNVTDAEGDAFYVAVAQIYNDLGITSQNTYIALRNEVNAAGATASDAVFDIIKEVVAETTAAIPVVEDLFLQALIDEQTQIPTDITTIETDRDLQSDQVLINAYNRGINALNIRKANLDARLAT